MTEQSHRIVPLGELSGVRMAEGDPDVRGWEVVGVDRRAIGRVHDLLIDTAAMQVRYLDVALDRQPTYAGEDRHVMVPVRHVRLDANGRRVTVAALTRDEVECVPAYTHGPVTAEYEALVRRHWDSDLGTAAGVDEDTFYRRYGGLPADADYSILYGGGMVGWKNPRWEGNAFGTENIVGRAEGPAADIPSQRSEIDAGDDADLLRGGVFSRHPGRPTTPPPPPREQKGQ